MAAAFVSFVRLKERGKDPIRDFPTIMAFSWRASSDRPRYNDSATLTVTTPELFLNGYNWLPIGDDGGRTVITRTQNLSGLDVHREITVPATGSQDFPHTVDDFTNPTGSAISTTVRIVASTGTAIRRTPPVSHTLALAHSCDSFADAIRPFLGRNAVASPSLPKAL